MNSKFNNVTEMNLFSMLFVSASSLHPICGFTYIIICVVGSGGRGSISTYGYIGFTVLSFIVYYYF